MDLVTFEECSGVELFIYLTGHIVPKKDLLINVPDIFLSMFLVYANFDIKCMTACVLCSSCCFSCAVCD